MGQEKSRSIKWVIIFLVLLSFTNAVVAVEETKLQWANGVSGVLKENGVLSHNGYSVKVVAFNAPVESDKYKPIPVEPVEAYVGLNISKNDTLIETAMLGRGEYFVTKDRELKVTAADFPPSSGKEWLYESYSPWVRLELSPRGKPKLEAVLNMDDEYLSAPNTEITAKITLKNTGTADADEVDLILKTELPLLKGEMSFHYLTIKKGTEISETVVFSSPIISELKSYNIFANASGIDAKKISYKSNVSKTVYITPLPIQQPSLKKSTSAKIYLKDHTMVSLSFKNNMNSELKNVSITDYLAPGFVQISNNTLHWEVDVPPNGEWYYRYIVKSTKAHNDGILLPATKAEFKIKNEYYMVQSNRPEITVYGPNIDISKQSDVSEIDPYGTITVTVTTRNNGSTPSKVTIKDDLPQEVTLVSGSTSKEEYLEANKETSFSYTIQSETDQPVRLPPATAEFFELGDRGTKANTVSNEVLISIKPAQTPEPTPSPVPETPVNSTDIEPAMEDVLTGVNVTKVPMQPDIVKPVTSVPEIDGNAILNILVGCDNIGNNEPRINVVSDVCNFEKTIDHSVKNEEPGYQNDASGKINEPQVIRSEPSDNLVKNPGFESGGNMPIDWTLVPIGENVPEWDTESHTGERSVMISIPGTTDLISGYPQSGHITVKASTTYTFSAFGKTLESGGTNLPVVRVVELDTNKNWVRQTNLPEFSKGTNDWTQKKVDIQTDPKTAYIYVMANIWNGYGTFWVDDMELRQK